MIRPPTDATLRRYGLDRGDWSHIACVIQGGLCPLCKLPLALRSLVIDHAHVKGFKRMKPERKRQHIRGVLHNYCNRRLVRKQLTLDKARNLVAYLEAHARRQGVAT